MKNLTLENITNTCKGTYHGPEALLSQEVTDVVIDSRKVERGDLFVAIDGENVNAHKFIPDTIEKGALYSFLPTQVAINAPMIVHARAPCYVWTDRQEAAPKLPALVRAGAQGAALKV